MPHSTLLLAVVTTLLGSGAVAKEGDDCSWVIPVVYPEVGIKNITITLATRDGSPLCYTGRVSCTDNGKRLLKRLSLAGKPLTPGEPANLFELIQKIGNLFKDTGDDYSCIISHFEVSVWVTMQAKFIEPHKTDKYVVFKMNTELAS